MSKLKDKLHKLSQAVPQPMGFRTNRPVEAGVKILVIGRMAVNSEALSKKFAGEADAILLYAGKAALKIEDIQKAAKALGDILWGVYLEESGSNTVALIAAGCDFVVFSPTLQIPDLPQDEKIGKILEVESSMDDGLLRAVNDLPADAVLITDTLDKNETLTIHRLMIYRHLANFIGKSLIVPVPANITEAELKALQDAEIDGVMAEMDGENLKGLRQTVNRLPPRTTKKRDKSGISLPRVGGGTAPATPDEEEEEDE